MQIQRNQLAGPLKPTNRAQQGSSATLFGRSFNIHCPSNLSQSMKNALNKAGAMSPFSKETLFVVATVFMLAYIEAKFNFIEDRHLRPFFKGFGGIPRFLYNKYITIPFITFGIGCCSESLVNLAKSVKGVFSEEKQDEEFALKRTAANETNSDSAYKFKSKLRNATLFIDVATVATCLSCLFLAIIAHETGLSSSAMLILACTVGYAGTIVKLSMRSANHIATKLKVA